MVIGIAHFTLTIASLLMAKSLERKIVLIPLWHEKFNFRNIVTKYLFRLKRFLLYRIIMKSVNPEVVCYTVQQRKSLRRIFKNVSVFPRGLSHKDRELFRKCYERRKRLGRSRQDKTINLVSVGRVDRNKYPFYIVHIVKAYKEMFPEKEVVFYIIGQTTKYTNQLIHRMQKEKVLENFNFVGFIDRKRLFEFFVNADVYVHPSFSESFGQSIIEALYAGIPTISCKTGIAPYLEQKGCMFTSDFSKPEETARKINELYQNSSLGEKMVRKARELIDRELRFGDFVNYVKSLVELAGEGAHHQVRG